MENLGINELISNRYDKLIHCKKDIDFSYQELGMDMQKYFLDQDRDLIWSLLHKYPERKLLDAFNICKKRGKNSVQYMLGVLNKLK